MVRLAMRVVKLLLPLVLPAILLLAVVGQGGTQVPTFFKGVAIIGAVLIVIVSYVVAFVPAQPPL